MFLKNTGLDTRCGQIAAAGSDLGQQTEILPGLSSTTSFSQPNHGLDQIYNGRAGPAVRPRPLHAFASSSHRSTKRTGPSRAHRPLPLHLLPFRPIAHSPLLRHCSLQITQRKADADGRRGKPRPPAPPEGRLPVSARLLRLSSLPIRLPCLLLFQGNSSPPPQTPRNYPP